LYVKYCRAGVYMLQEALRLMGVEQDAEGIAFTRTLINSVPKDHSVHPYIKTAARDLMFDGGIVDTFLHKQDRAYTVAEVLKLIDNSRLSFQGWGDNLSYYPDGSVPSNHAIYRKIAALPVEKQWSVIELILQLVGCHTFLARKKGGDESKYRIDFDSPSLLKTVPSLRYGSGIKVDNGSVIFRRLWHAFPLAAFEQRLLAGADGKTTVEEIILARTNGSAEQKEAARLFFRRMGRMGHVLYSTCAGER
ncbi:MAG: hypothetical protein PHE27_05575, partial [Alphaproteobacteria bacterium]|nr:hypothetical protein [Alphaproteobacteria bacterium]